MEITGYIASIFIGISLGLIGSGGSILTVPVLVYLFGIGVEMSTAYSLFIVGSTALVGGVRNAFLGNVNYKTAVVFTIPAFIAVYTTRAYLVPAIPSVIMTLGTYVLTKDIAIMVFFALCAQCASTLVIIGKETASWVWPLVSFTYMTALAWIGAFCIFQLGTTLGW